MSRRITISASLVLVAVGLTAGCAPWATYPPIEHTSKLINPNFEPMPSLMADAVRYAKETYGTVPDVTFNLPAGMSYKVYDKVIAKLGYGRPMQPEDTLAYHITAVRTRGPEAEIDVIVPRADGLHELVTIRFQQKFAKGYQVESAREWRVRADPPPANYSAPPQPVTEVVNVEPSTDQQQ